MAPILKKNTLIKAAGLVTKIALFLRLELDWSSRQHLGTKVAQYI